MLLRQAERLSAHIAPRSPQGAPIPGPGPHLAGSSLSPPPARPGAADAAAGRLAAPKMDPSTQVATAVGAGVAGALVAAAAGRVAAVQTALKRGVRGEGAEADDSDSSDAPAFGIPHGDWQARGKLDAATMALVALSEGLIGIAAPRLAMAAIAAALPGGTKTVAYGSAHSRQCMSVFEPSGRRRSAPAPTECAFSACVFVHGGAWCWGERFYFASLGQNLADELGCTAYLPSYRSYPHGDARMMAADVVSACRAAAKRAGPGLLLVGHSSGASVSAAAVATMAQDSTASQAAAPSEPRIVRKFVWLSGVADIGEHFAFEASRTLTLPWGQQVRGVEAISPMAPATGGPKRWHLASPETILRRLSRQEVAAMPPMVVVHGTSDETVPFSSSGRLARSAAQLGLLSAFIAVDKGTHMDTILPMMDSAFDRPIGTTSLGPSLRALLFEVLAMPVRNTARL